MSTTNSLDLYSLLPAVYRIRDAERGYPLRALLGLASAQAQIVKADIDGLWDDLFIETCADWVIPYIGDLVANNPISDAVVGRRADVARTIYYRRRKGTLPMLEQMARDVTGWDAHAVAFFEELGWTQNLNHLRFDPFTSQISANITRVQISSNRLTVVCSNDFTAGQRVRFSGLTSAPFLNDSAVTILAATPFQFTADFTHADYGSAADTGTVTAWADPFSVSRVGSALLRDMDAMDRLNGPFDTTTHTVDVRPPCQVTGWYNIRKIGFFLWRLQNFFVQEVTPRRSSIYSDGFYFSPIGNPASLFTNPAPVSQGTQLVTETQVQAPIRKMAFYFHPEHYYLQPDQPNNFYQDHPLATRSIAIYHGKKADPANLILPSRIVCGDLANWTPPISGLVAVDVSSGRIAFARGETPVDGVTVSYTYGFSGTLGGGPYDRRSVQPLPGDPGPAIPDTVANLDSLDASIRVPSTGINTLNQALAVWNPAAHARTVIQIEDNRSYEENLTISFPGVAPPPGTPSRALVIQAGNLQRPALIGNIIVNGGTGAEEFVLNGLLTGGGLHVQANLGFVEIVHSTLVPGLGLDEQGQPLQPDTPSVVVDAPADSLQLLIDHSITGALRLPEGMTGLIVRDSIIDSPRREAEADFLPVLLSGSLSPFPTLSSATPAINITIGDQGPYLARLPQVPTTLAQARDALEAAIRKAHFTLPFTATRVLSAANRLIVLPGTDEQPVIELAGTDKTATELRLDPASSRQTSAVISGVLSPFPTITSAKPAVTVTVATAGSGVAKLAGVPASVPQARDQLQAAIQAAGGTQGFTRAVVANLGNQLVVISGDGAAPITFTTAPPDVTTLTELMLETQRPAIAGDEAADVPGPPSTLLRTTVFGEVHVQQLVLASEVIFNSLVISQRRQNGCVRFSFVPEGSQTPRRYRCQPDFEIEKRVEEAERVKGAKLSDSESDAIRDDVRSWLLPSFTDVHYGLPAYGQLSVSCPQQIQTGASDGSEMGAFCFLKQPQRFTSLRVRLQEYLPFGLEPDLIYVS